MDACPACTASITRHSKLHCTSPGCVWLICTKCMSTLDNETGAYNKPGIWGNQNGYIKAEGGESVCQPPSTPKSSETKPSPSTTPTDQPQ